GLVFPEGAENEPHVEAELPGGLRLALDTEETTGKELTPRSAAGAATVRSPWRQTLRHCHEGSANWPGAPSSRRCH
ncbi:hypothetical protein ABT040_45380, partial [Streptomyces sp. NPDC002688]